MKIDKHAVLAISIGAVLLLAFVDGYQDIWRDELKLKSAGYLLLLVVCATAPACILFILAKDATSSKVRVYSYYFAVLFVVVSIVFWTAGVASGTAPLGPGAAQMHLLIWPIVIPILSLIIFSLLVVAQTCYRTLRA